MDLLVIEVFLVPSIDPGENYNFICSRKRKMEECFSKKYVIMILFGILTFATFTENVNITDQRNHRNWNLINPDNCGLSNEFRIIGGIDAQLGQFPWIVRLGFINKRNKIIFKCAGSIINSKYIVSAAHCFKNDKLKVVRVGEYDEGLDPDCDDDFICAPPVTDYEVENITKHPEYDHPTLYSNDIALIRVRGEIQFNDFVAPICFEYGDLLQKDYVGKLVEVAGWGIYDLDLELPSSILQVVRLPIMKRETCKDVLAKKSVITEKQLCAGGVIGKDSCGGDSGGPLMAIQSVEGGPPRYYLIGLVSFGTRRCAKSTLPGVYTRMAYFLPWILDNINP